jgi:hypothetical protein
MKVRALLDFLKTWIDQRVADVAGGRVSNPEKTFVYYWLKNAGSGEHFSYKDMVFETSTIPRPQSAGQHDLPHRVASEQG